WSSATTVLLACETVRTRNLRRGGRTLSLGCCSWSTALCLGDTGVGLGAHLEQVRGQIDALILEFVLGEGGESRGIHRLGDQRTVAGFAKPLVAFRLVDDRAGE